MPGRRFSVSTVLWVLIGAVLHASGSMAATATIKNIPPRMHGAPADSSPADISWSIVSAGGELRWYEVAKGDGFVDLATVVRNKHEATVRVGFDDTNLWIDYVDSVNLDYSPDDLVLRRGGGRATVRKGPRIHKNYNKWVEVLARRIGDRVSHPVVRAKSQRERPSPLLVADELEKLDALRQRGVLTDEEFEKQKARLLGD